MLPHESPPGEELTVPVPLPMRATVTGYANVAVTVCAASIRRVQGPVPAQAPLHPAKLAPGSGSAVSVTHVPST